MTDPQLQALYTLHLAGLPLSDISVEQLKCLHKGWQDGNGDLLPSAVIWNNIFLEIRRREREAASKPMRPIDRNFYK